MNIILISAIWCTSCLVMRSRWKLVTDYFSDASFQEIDFDQEEDRAKKYCVGEILPVLIIEENGKEIKRIIGEKSKAELQKIIQEITR